MDINLLITDDNILNIIIFGSRMYQTNNSDSDWDYVVIQQTKKPIDDINIHCFTVEEYKTSLRNGDIVVLETYFAPNTLYLKREWYEEGLVTTIDKEALRRNISMLTDNSWVKGKKKLIVVGDYDLKAGLKSVFHSFRILDFAKQILLHDSIIDYTSMNWLYKELTFLSYDYSRNELWGKIDDKYRGLFNKHRSEFKSLCPIVKTKEKYNDLKKILVSHNVFTDKLFNELKHLI